MVAQRKIEPDDDAIYNDLYERCGKPLEAEHWGKFLAVSPQGKTVMADTLVDVVERAHAAFGPGNYFYKIGERAVGRIRRSPWTTAGATR